MKKQVVSINGKYAARVKRWYFFEWKYLSSNYTFTRPDYVQEHCLLNTLDEAKERLKRFDCNYTVIFQDVDP